jgi:alpha-2-macroglobulin
MPKAARWLAENRDGDYWYSTKQTSMVIQGLTDYLALSGELANTSDVEVLVNGTSVGKHHFGSDDALPRHGRSNFPRLRLPTAEKSRSARAAMASRTGPPNSWYSADRKNFQQGQLALNITRDYYLLQKKQDKPTDPITYDLVPLKGPVHIGDIVAVKLALNGTSWKYLQAEDPIPAGTEFLPQIRGCTR